jgi:hypothetical protein
MKFVTVFFVALVLVTAMIAGMGKFASAATTAAFVVNDVGDDSDSNPGDGECATAGGVCTLRAALEETNALPGADVVEFALPQDSMISATTDELLITDSVTISGPVPYLVNVNTGFNFHRVLRVAAEEDAEVRIRGLEIAGGVLPVGNGAGIFLETGTLYLDSVRIQYNMAQNGRGGGIAVEAGTLYVTGSAIDVNSAYERGGGIYNHWFGTVVISGSRLFRNSSDMGGGAANIGQFTAVDVDFEENEAESDGGGIYNVGGSLTLMSSVVDDNLAHRGGGLFHDGGKASVFGTTFSSNESSGRGGAIDNRKPLTIIESTLQENSASMGGAIDNSGTLTITRSLLEGNAAQSRGGAIYNSYDAVLAVYQSTFYDNRATGSMDTDRSGGAINNFNATATIDNSTISGNFAEEHGGGINNFGGTMLINHSTVAFNESPNGGGIRAGEEGMMQVRNSIIARNGDGDDCYVHPANVNGFVAFNANLDSDGSCPMFTLSGQEPLLSILMDNGGNALTHLLDANSPAVDAASADGCMAVGNVDQRGFVRLGEGESNCDLGALEVDGTQPPEPVETPEPPDVPDVPPDEPEEPEPEEPPADAPDEPEEPPVMETAEVMLYLPSVEKVGP